MKQRHSDFNEEELCMALRASLLYKVPKTRQVILWKLLLLSLEWQKKPTAWEPLGGMYSFNTTEYDRGVTWSE